MRDVSPGSICVLSCFAASWTCRPIDFFSRHGPCVDRVLFRRDVGLWSRLCFFSRHGPALGSRGGRPVLSCRPKTGDTTRAAVGGGGAHSGWSGPPGAATADTVVAGPPRQSQQEEGWHPTASGAAAAPAGGRRRPRRRRRQSRQRRQQCRLWCAKHGAVWAVRAVRAGVGKSGRGRHPSPAPAPPANPYITSGSTPWPTAAPRRPSHATGTTAQAPMPPHGHSPSPPPPPSGAGRRRRPTPSPPASRPRRPPQLPPPAPPRRRCGRCSRSPPLPPPAACHLFRRRHSGTTAPSAVRQSGDAGRALPGGAAKGATPPHLGAIVGPPGRPTKWGQCPAAAARRPTPPPPTPARGKVCRPPEVGHPDNVDDDSSDDQAPMTAPPRGPSSPSPAPSPSLKRTRVVRHHSAPSTATGHSHQPTVTAVRTPLLTQRFHPVPPGAPGGEGRGAAGSGSEAPAAAVTAVEAAAADVEVVVARSRGG